MKRKHLLLLVAFFTLPACSRTPSKKHSTVVSSSNVTSSSLISTSQQTSVSSAQPLTSFTPTTSSGTSYTPSTASSATSGTSSPIPVTEEFRFSSEEITIDISSGKTASLSIVNTFDETENISWSVPHSSVLRLDSMTTKHNQTNVINAIRVGDVRLKGEANGKEAYCDVHVINSKVKPTTGTANISIYAINDYHGAVTGTFGLRELGTFIKQKVGYQNTLFLDQGDTFQGSLLSNYRRGRLITEVYNAAGVSARTIGNHDFDWGPEEIIRNNKMDYHGYSTAVLAANIYDYDFLNKQTGTTQQSDIGQEYTTFTLESGVKVGVVGVIGDACLTSITSKNVQDYDFVSDANTIRKVSDKLRTEENCDVIVATIHQGFADCSPELITQVSPVTNKKYVDFVLNGHSHRDEIEELNGVTFAQFGTKCEKIGKANLTYDFATGELTNTTVYSLNPDTLLDDIPVIDPEINAICDKYEEEVKDIRDEVLTNQMYGYFTAYEGMPNLVSKAMYEASIEQGFDISYAITNKAREDLTPSEDYQVTYEQLYESLPFDNVIYIVNVSGKDIRNEMSWESNSMYRGNNADALAPLDDDKTYTIACIDYLAFHCNANRDYNYFPSVEEVGVLTIDDEYYTYREITADYLKKQTDIVSSGYYLRSKTHFNPQLFDQTIEAE